MNNFFLSYAEADLQWAEWIAWQLECAGYDVAIDAWDLRPGANSILKAHEYFKKDACIVVVLSPDYLIGDSTNAEWSTAFHSDPTGVRRSIFPVRVRSCQINGLLQTRSYIDLVDKTEAQAKEILLRAAVMSRAKPAAKPHWPGLKSSGPRYPGGIDPTPHPQYPSEEIRIVAESLDECYSERELLASADQDTIKIDERILDLRRKLREGGQLRAGDVLSDQFKLIDKLGTGGFATVWRGYDRKARRLVAVKVLHGQFAQDRSRVDRFFRGSRKMSELQHQSIVRVIEERCVDSGYQFFVMEYIKGSNLRQAVLSGVISEKDALEAVLCAGKALSYAHANGIVHRDVKPTNIVLCDYGGSKLTDFDLVRALDTTGGTRTGMMGTVVYAAPELLERANDAGVEADIYGLGMTAVFVFYGADLPVGILRSTGRFIRALKCTEAIREVLLKATSWDRKERYGTADALCVSLEEALASGPFRASRSRVSANMRPLRRSVRFTLDVLRFGFSIFHSTYRTAIPKGKRGDELEKKVSPFESLRFLLQEKEKLDSVFVGRYQVNELVGSGAMGSVFRGWDPKLKRVIALKTVRVDAEDIDFRRAAASLLDEAIIAARFQHPGIVAVYDVEDYGDAAFIAMEYVDGIDLGTYLASSGPLQPGQLMLLAGKIARALAAAHAHGLLHHDVKPANVLMGRDGAVKISDFGISELICSATRNDNVICGTPGYIAPECFLGDEYTPNADLFSLGVLMYEALAGHHPFVGRDLRETILNSAAAEPKPIERLLPNVPQGLADLIPILLSKDPRDRVLQATDVADILEQMVGHDSVLLPQFPENIHGSNRSALRTQMVTLSRSKDGL